MKARELPQDSRLRVSVLGDMRPAVLGRLDGSYFNCRLTDRPAGDPNAVFQLWHGEEMTLRDDGTYELVDKRPN